MIKILKSLVACGSLVLLFACAPQPETIVTEVPAMRASSIYNQDSVYWYRYNHGDMYGNMASSYFSKAKEAEEQNLVKAIFYAKRAITLQPTLEHYTFLSRLLNTSEQYDELLQLYRLVAHEAYIKGKNQYLFGPPDEETLYEFLVMEFLTYKYVDRMQIEYAQSQNFSLANLKKKFFADSRIKLAPQSEAYKMAQLQFMSEAELEVYAKSEQNFKEYLQAFADTATSFEIIAQQVQAFNFKRDYWEEDFQTTSRQLFMPYLQERQENPRRWLEFNLKHRIRVNKEVHAVVYAIDTSATACPADMRHVYYRLVTYSLKGTIIDSEIVADQAGEAMATVQFSGARFTITDHRRTWKNPYNKEEFDNFLLKTEKTGERTYEISSSGKIEPLPVLSVAPAPVAEGEPLEEGPTD